MGTATFQVYGWLVSLVWDSESLGKPSFSMEGSQWHHGLSCYHEVIVWLLQLSQTAFITRLAGMRAFKLLFALQRSRTCSPLFSPCLEDCIGRAVTECGSAHLAEGSDRIHPKCILHVFNPVQYGCHSRSNLVVSLIFGCRSWLL